MSSRSEDEVFSDAATEFQDSGFSSGAATEFQDSGLGKDLTSVISFKDCEDNDILPSPRNSADGSPKEISDQRCMPILPIGTPENHDIGLRCSKDSEDKNGSATTIETEMLICVPKDSREVGVGDSAASCSVVQPDDAVENGESKLNHSVQPAKLISETESSSEKGPNVTSDMVELKEEFSDRLSSKTTMSGNVEQEIDGKGNSGVSFQVNLQTDAAYSMDSCVDKKEKEKESVYVLSVPDDFSVLDDAEIKLQGFEDHKRVKLPHCEEIILDIEDQVEHCVSQEKFDTFLSNPMYKDIITEEVNEIECLQSDRVSNSQDDKNESEISSYNKVHGECVVEDHMASPERNKFERTSVEKELIHAGALNDSHTGESGAAASRTSAVILQGEGGNGSFNPQHDTTVGDVLIETSSRTDSLEGHWGSISVLSTQSAMDTETLPSTGSQALSEAEKVNLKKSKVASEEEHRDKFHKFEPPSFMTLVEHGGSDQNAVGVSETPGAGWFPSLTHTGNESQGRKKNEEIIEKVANWNATQHSALKKLANSEAKPMSPNSNQNPNPVVLGAKVKSNQNPNPVALGAKVKSTEAEPTSVEAEKEWDSPASDIKREKRKVKGRPFWVQFACCSSVN